MLVLELLPRRHRIVGDPVTIGDEEPVANGPIVDPPVHSPADVLGCLRVVALQGLQALAQVLEFSVRQGSDPSAGGVRGEFAELQIGKHETGKVDRLGRIGDAGAKGLRRQPTGDRWGYRAELLIQMQPAFRVWAMMPAELRVQF